MNQAAAEPNRDRATVHAASSALSDERAPLLVPGETCWRIETAERLSVLVDADAYFAALRSAISQASKHVFIIGWDVDSRTRLLRPRDAANDGLPTELLPFLRAVLRRRPSLHVYVLTWDFSVIYALEREWMPSWVFSHAHPRLHFMLDRAHVVGASQHQKLVVVDDELAFTGGMDLTIRRWDSSAHAGHDPRRVDPEGEPYGPIHDVQLCVQGPAARALAESARERLQRALEKGHGGTPLGGQSVPELQAELEHEAHASLWPARVPVDFSRVPVGLARTYSSTLTPAEDIREIAALTRRAFTSAERYVYIENQYFTAWTAAAALAESLAAPEGPEIILVLPQLETGWLEQSSMGVLRRQVLARVRRSDRHGRLHIYYPKLPDSQHGLAIHGKLLICDDRVLKSGSANLSNRSLGLDTECDLCLEARPDQRSFEYLSNGIHAVLVRMLSEHLDLPQEQCRAQLSAAGSLHAFIESQRGRPRCLEPVPEQLPDPVWDLGALGDWVIDPERPMAAETFIASLFPLYVRIPWLRGIAASIALIAPVLIMAQLHVAHSVSLDRFVHEPHMLGLLWLGYTLGCSAFVPLSLLLSAVCTLLPAKIAFGFAVSGALVSSCLSHLAGRKFRPLTLRFVRGRYARRLQHSARLRAFRATVIARLLPVGNFAASNLFAGALQVPFGRFCLGNWAGLSLGVALLLLFAKSAQLAVRAPNAGNIALSCGAGALLLAVCYGVARVFTRPPQSTRDNAMRPIAPV